MYHLFDGRIKHTVQLEFPGESSAVSRVRQISASPDGKMFAILTDTQLLAGQQKLHVLLSDEKICDISIGNEHVAVRKKLPDEYLLFNTFSMQQIYSCPIAPQEIVIFAQQFDRTDKVLGPIGMRDLQESTISDILVDVDVRESLLNTALNSEHLESSANVLKIAEHSNEIETCRMLRVLGKLIKKVF